MIVACGEALIDFMPTTTAEGATAFQPFNGGSVYNVAIALGRLGCDVGFFGGLSQDFFGHMLVDELQNSHVDISLAVKSAYATTLAFVSFDSGQPEYVFLDEMSAGRMLEVDQLPELDSAANALHFGSISLISEPAAASYEKLAKREKEKRILSIDPNIRPTLVSDRQTYQERLQRMIALADIIKISDEDLAWLAPDISFEDCAMKWLGQGAALVVVTKGSEGATAYTSDCQIEQPSEKVTVADTVGAGDTFMAGLLASLDGQGLLSRDTLSNLDRSTLATAMAFASRVAAITVSRKGANPPWAGEL